jgi:hypothetical protein
LSKKIFRQNKTIKGTVSLVFQGRYKFLWTIKRSVKILAERKVQHVRGLQPPPLNPEYDPPEEENPGSSEQKPLTIEIFFLTSFEPHLGQTVSFSVTPTR